MTAIMCLAHRFIAVNSSLLSLHLQPVRDWSRLRMEAATGMLAVWAVAQVPQVLLLDLVSILHTHKINIIKDFSFSNIHPVKFFLLWWHKCPSIYKLDDITVNSQHKEYFFF